MATNRTATSLVSNLITRPQSINITGISNGTIIIINKSTIRSAPDQVDSKGTAQGIGVVGKYVDSDRGVTTVYDSCIILEDRA